MTTVKELCLKYFSVDDATKFTWKCQCGAVIIQKKNTGWTNLANHIKSQHGEDPKSVPTGQATISFAKSKRVTSKGSNIYCWLNWVCSSLKPFSFVDDVLTREYTKLEPISHNSLKKYMELVTKEVQKRIQSALPEKLALAIDGWTKNSTHFVGVFAIYPAANTQGYDSALLAFSPLFSETSFTANDHYQFLEWVLSVYGKTMSDVIAIIGDNAEVNKALSNSCEKPLIGCASHRFNLAVSLFLKEHTEIIAKISDIMIKLRTSKYRGKLRQKTDLGPVLKNETHWSSTFAMLNRYIRLHPFLLEPEFSGNQAFATLLLSPSDFLKVKELASQLQYLNSVTVALQDSAIDMADVRGLFDKVLEDYPEMVTYLGTNAKIIHSPKFESAIVKIQEKMHDTLDDEELAAVAVLKKEVILTQTRSDEQENSVAEFMKRRKMTKAEHDNGYVETRFLLPTSNLLERFFSVSGLAYDDFRQNMTPMNLEMQLFLKTNKRFWDEELVSKCCA